MAKSHGRKRYYVEEEKDEKASALLRRASNEAWKNWELFSGLFRQGKKLLPPVIRPVAAACALCLNDAGEKCFTAKGNPGFQNLRNKNRKPEQHLACHQTFR
jgi:hypothetical protein